MVDTDTGDRTEAQRNGVHAEGARYYRLFQKLVQTSFKSHERPKLTEPLESMKQNVIEFVIAFVIETAQKLAMWQKRG